LGYCVSPAAWTAEFRKIHQFNAFCCFTPTQIALSQHLRKKDNYLSLAPFMQAKRDLFLNYMNDSKFDFLPSSGSYFVCATYNKISSLPAKDLAIQLTKEIGVANIPVSSFYMDGRDDRVLRFCFAKKDETLREAAAKFKTVFD
jgi:methionine aminotransferase